MKPVTLYAGSDDFAVQQAATAFTQKHMPEDPLNYEVVNAQVDGVDAALAQIAALKEAILTLPFLGGSKLVWWKNVTFLADSPLGRNSSVLEALEGLLPVLQQVDGTSVSLLVSAIGVDKRRAFYKALGKIAEVKAFDLPDVRKMDAGEIIDQIESQLSQAKVVAEPAVAERLFAACGADPRALAQAVEKLSLYAGEGGKVTAQEARALVGGNREAAIWDFCDAVLAGKPKAALAELELLLKQGESEIGILILLSQQVRLAALGGVLLEYKLMRLVPKGAFTNAEVSPQAEPCLPRKKSGEATSTWQLGQVCQKTRARPPAFWIGAVETLHQANKQIVTGAADKRQVLERVVLQLSA
ncbi:MAG: DNA polymerase III subunit delta [Verrucomicrobium sp.]|nr:DNA polymerase III subunit delta [Verrucomicrobium sp.]